MINNPPSDPDSSPVCELWDQLASPLQGIANLTFLASMEAENPEKVRIYLGMADERMQEILQIALQSYPATATQQKVN